MHLGKLLPCCIEANVYNNHISAETFFEIYTVYTYASYTLLHRANLRQSATFRQDGQDVGIFLEMFAFCGVSLLVSYIEFVAFRT